MPKRIQIGGSDFGQLVRKDLLFVDKSLFIKEILDDQNKVTLITRPRRCDVSTLFRTHIHAALQATS